MDDELASTFGEDFAQSYENKVQEKRNEREQLSEEKLIQVAHKAVNEVEFDAENPHFKWQSDSGMKHDVLLMQVPDMDNNSVWSYINEFDNGGLSMPLDYMGEWMSSIFNDEDMARSLTEGKYYIVVGEKSQYENDDGEVNESMAPVRGVIPLEKAKEYADRMLEDEGFTDSESDSSSTTTSETKTADPEDSSGSSLRDFDDDEDEEEEEASSDDDDEEIDAGFLDDTTEDDDDGWNLPYDEIAQSVEELAEKDDRVWELDDPEHDHTIKVAKIVKKQNNLDAETRDVIEVVLDVIEGHNESDSEPTESLV